MKPLDEFPEEYLRKEWAEFHEQTGVSYQDWRRFMQHEREARDGMRPLLDADNMGTGILTQGCGVVSVIIAVVAVAFVIYVKSH